MSKPIARLSKPFRNSLGIGASAIAALALTVGAGLSLMDRPSAYAAGEEFSGTQKQAIEQIVRDYLLNNPEIMLEVQQAFEAKMDAQREAHMAAALSAEAGALFHAKAAPSVGAADADVTVVEFFDYNCGYCRRAIKDIAALVEGDKKVRVVFKEFPIFGADSEAAARVAIAAKEQGRYWDVHRALFEHGGKVNEASALAIAKKLGLDMDKLKADMVSDATTAEITEVRDLAEKMGIQGTPHFFVGDKIIPGAPEDLLDQLKARVAQVRKDGCSVC